MKTIFYIFSALMMINHINAQDREITFANETGKEIKLLIRYKDPNEKPYSTTLRTDKDVVVSTWIPDVGISELTITESGSHKSDTLLARKKSSDDQKAKNVHYDFDMLLNSGTHYKIKNSWIPNRYFDLIKTAY